MNLDDVLKYGNQTVMNSIGGLEDTDADVAGVCGYWSVRNILQHLASHELVLNDILNSYLGSKDTPNLANYLAQGYTFNDIEVDKRKDQSFADALKEYEAASAKTRGLAVQVALDKRRQAGLIPWYGEEYDLEDLVAYSNYGHKREHCAQIAVYRDTLK